MTVSKKVIAFAGLIAVILTISIPLVSAAHRMLVKEAKTIAYSAAQLKANSATYPEWETPQAY